MVYFQFTDGFNIDENYYAHQQELGTTIIIISGSKSVEIITDSQVSI